MTQPKIPLHIQKALSGGSPEEALTDYQPTEPMISIGEGVRSSYRTPADRASGNDVFRRYSNGVLDLDYAKHKVLDMIHRVKEGHTPTEIEKCILTCGFPGAFSYMDPDVADSLRSVNLRVSPQEMVEVAMAVSACLAEELNYNAGMGGGSVPGRSNTRS